jgi:hypothetical protein
VKRFFPAESGWQAREHRPWFRERPLLHQSCLPPRLPCEFQLRLRRERRWFHAFPPPFHCASRSWYAFLLLFLYAYLSLPYD